MRGCRKKLISCGTVLACRIMNLCGGIWTKIEDHDFDYSEYLGQDYLEE